MDGTITMARTPKQITEKGAEVYARLKTRFDKLHTVVEGGNLKHIQAQVARLHMEAHAEAKAFAEFLGVDPVALTGGHDKEGLTASTQQPPEATED